MFELRARNVVEHEWWPRIVSREAEIDVIQRNPARMPHIHAVRGQRAEHRRFGIDILRFDRTEWIRRRRRQPGASPACSPTVAGSARATAVPAVIKDAHVAHTDIFNQVPWNAADDRRRA